LVYTFRFCEKLKARTNHIKRSYNSFTKLFFLLNATI